MHRTVVPLILAVMILIPAKPADAQLAVGSGPIAEVWNTNCASCHGRNGQGGGAGTSSLLDDDYTAGGSDRELFNSTKAGLPDSGMPGFGETMSDPQIWALVVYIRELQYRDRRRREGSPRPDAQGVYTSEHHRFKIETVIDRGLSVPWSVEFLPDGRMLVAERPGTLRIHSTGKPGGKLSEPVADTPQVRHRGQGGLMDVKIHPDYQENGWVYMSYSHALEGGNRGPGMTRIVRGRIKEEGGRAAWTDEQVLWEARPEHYQPTDLHFGCRIVFDPPGADGKRLGHTYFAIGERGRGELAQDLGRPNGKIYRINDDGTIPRDNPFVGQTDVYEAIWSYGHRNPQGLIFDLDGRLWSTEHGPRGGDEFNLIRRGRNYGWPLVSYGMNYQGSPFRTPWPELHGLDPDDFQAVVDRWLPSIGACGLDVGTGGAFPNWRNDLFAGGLSGENVDRIRVRQGSGEEEVEVVEREEILHGLGRVRDVVTGPDGSIYVVLNGPDTVLRLVPADEADRREPVGH